MTKTATATDTAARYLCKLCGAESPTGVGYAASNAYAFPAPASNCPNEHVEG